MIIIETHFLRRRNDQIKLIHIFSFFCNHRFSSPLFDEFFKTYAALVYKYKKEGGGQNNDIRAIRSMFKMISDIFFHNNRLQIV